MLGHVDGLGVVLGGAGVLLPSLGEVLARPWGVKKRTRGNGLIWGVCGHKVARCRLEVPFSLCALARDADRTFTAPQHKLASLRLGCVRVSRFCPVLKLEAYEDHDRPHEEHGREVGEAAQEVGDDGERDHGGEAWLGLGVRVRVRVRGEGVRG